MQVPKRSLAPCSPRAIAGARPGTRPQAGMSEGIVSFSLPYTCRADLRESQILCKATYVELYPLLNV